MNTDKAKTSLDGIRRRYLLEGQTVSSQIISKLRKDSRRGAVRLLQLLRTRYDQQRSERSRIEQLLNFERLLWKSGIRDIAGVDEVGIGPLAGPVVAAAVVFRPTTNIAGVDDSKRLDPATRKQIALEIRQQAAYIAVGVVSVTEIDKLNIYHAGLLAMQRAVEALPTPPEHVLVDARTVPGLPMPQSAFTKGDGINFSIAAASIIAKTERDRMMEELDGEYPGYGFASHKGYGTPEHRNALLRLGPTPIHRMSFPVISELRGACSDIFYELKARLEEVRTRESLVAFESQLKNAERAMPASEHRKIRLWIVRRWKLVQEITQK